MPATVHASAVLINTRAVLIRGPSGAGKSRLALDLIDAARGGLVRFARLVGDDRVYLASAGGRLLVRSAETLAGLIEVRGAGIVHTFLDLDVAGGAIALAIANTGPAQGDAPRSRHQGFAFENFDVDVQRHQAHTSARPFMLRPARERIGRLSFQHSVRDSGACDEF